MTPEQKRRKYAATAKYWKLMREGLPKFLSRSGQGTSTRRKATRSLPSSPSYQALLAEARIEFDAWDQRFSRHWNATKPEHAKRRRVA